MGEGDGQSDGHTACPSLNDLKRGDWRDVNWNPHADHGLSIASRIFKHLPDNPATGRLIIDALIERMSSAPEYASFLAVDYATEDYFIKSLISALEKRQPGSVYVACNLVRAGYKSFLPDAYAAARQIAANSMASGSYAESRDKQAAKSLLRE